MHKKIEGAHALRTIREQDQGRLMAWVLRCQGNPAGCWEWPGHRDGKGYGQVWYKGRACWAHRVVYVLMGGTIEWFQTLHHTCHNPSCCNPAHLQLAHRDQHNNDYSDDSF